MAKGNSCGLQEVDPAETFAVMKGESSRVPRGCCCVLCGETVDVMREHDAWETPESLWPLILGSQVVSNLMKTGMM